MITFLLAIATLVLGFVFLSKKIEAHFDTGDSSHTPAIRLKDGVDFIPMKPWKMYTIQFLNIAGLGPIFGAILGAMYGPLAYLWIVLGNLFIGATHDYFSGMASLQNNGASLPELVGKYLGKGFRQALRIFTLLLLIMVGVAFVTGPADLLTNLSHGGLKFWLLIIFAYYLLATLLPINQIIGKIYPLFGAALILMALGIAAYMLWGSQNGSFHLNELKLSDLRNLHHTPAMNIIYPMLFIVISCGAISGFHATQSPMMARCMTNRKQGRYIFYGAMITEGIVAIIWATVAMNYFGDTQGLNDAALSGKNPAWIVNTICHTWFGQVGAAFAIIGVIAAPITTGDTAFRSARLTLADMFKYPQKKLKNRLIISLPLFALGFTLSQIDFATIWKYLGLFNQILAVITLWTGAMYLVKTNKSHWIMSLPATFMTTICISYILVAPTINGGLALQGNWPLTLGLFLGLGTLFLFLNKSNSKKNQID